MRYTGIVFVVLTDTLGREWSAQVPVAIAGQGEPAGAEVSAAAAPAERACLRAIAMAGDEARVYLIQNKRATDITAQLANMEATKPE
jgi:hypothetical protein